MGNPSDIEKAARKAAIKCAIRGLDKEADTILTLADSHAQLLKWKADTISGFADAVSTRQTLRLAGHIADAEV